MEEYQILCCTFETIPYAIRNDYRGIVVASVIKLCDVYGVGGNRGETEKVRAWKLFLLLPRMLFYKSKRGGKSGDRALKTRIRLFDEGKWDVLLAAGRL